MDALDDPRLAATDRTETLRELREQIDVLWRTSQLRVNAMDPIDEVRSVMTAFDETLFRVVPTLYRSMDHAVAGADSGSVPTAVPPFLRFGSWVGADRDGNPFVTRARHPGGRHHPGRSCAARARAGRRPGSAGR